jgi:hypothetical protein
MRASQWLPSVFLLACVLGASPVQGEDGGVAQPTTVWVVLEDQNGGPVLEGRVVLSDRTETRTATRSPEGFYVGSARGRVVRVTAQALGYVAESRDFGLEGDPTPIRFQMRKGRDLALDVRSEDGSPVQYLSIHLVPERFAGLVHATELDLGPVHSFDRAGSHVIHGLEIDKYAVRIGSPGFLTTQVRAAVPRLGSLEVRLVESVTIDVQVANPDGTPAKSVFVKAALLPDGQRFGEYTFEDGGVRLERLKPGAYRVWAEDASGRRSDAVVVDVQIGKPASVGLTMRP